MHLRLVQHEFKSDSCNLIWVPRKASLCLRKHYMQKKNPEQFLCVVTDMEPLYTFIVFKIVYVCNAFETRCTCENCDI